MLRDTGFDAIILENMHDAPYVNAPHDPAIVSTMTRVACEVRSALGDALPIGVQVLSRGEHEALAIALAAGLQFIRCENFVFGHLADEGLMTTAAAGPLLRYRRQIGAEHIKIFADVQKKHASHAMSTDLAIADWVHGAEFFGADGVIVTGPATGVATSLSDVEQARTATKLPVLVGSGVTPEQVEPLLRHADGLIVGSWIKHDGAWHQPVDPVRCAQLVAARR